MLVQAKRLKPRGPSWIVEILYNDGNQYQALLDTAERFDVPAMYAVYLGGSVMRSQRSCPHEGNDVRPCDRCLRSAVSVIPAYLLGRAWGDDANTETILSESVPLEDLGDPGLGRGSVVDVNAQALSGDLGAFLSERQLGAREVAKRIFAIAAKHRSSAFGATTLQLAPTEGDVLFKDLPTDRTAFPGPYFPHFLNGLRTALPTEFGAVLAGEPPAVELSRHLAGVVFIATG